MKKLITIFLICSVLFSTLCISTTVFASGINVYIDGIPVNFTYDTGFPFISSEGRTMVPLRATMEAFGASVEWEQSTQTAFVRKDTTTVRCVINNKNLYRNNVAFYNDAAAVINNGRTYLPIRAVLEAFGATVSWDGNVIITSPGADSIIYGIENNPSVTTNYWGTWNNALSYKANGMYNEAISTILSISSVFIKDNNSSSCAMLYKHLGECYSYLSDYDKASSCFKREAYYWSITPGMEQSRIDAQRRSTIIRPSAQMYIKTTDRAMSARTDFCVKLEPRGGIYLGAYSEGDTNIYNPYDPNRFYMDTFPQLVGRDMAAYLLYLPYGMNIAHYKTHIDRAKATGKILQFSLEPHTGLHHITYTDGYLIELAKEMERSSCKMMLRFGGEMNDPTCPWYSADGNLYISKFRIIADIFHTYAPSIPIIWAPNHYPMDTIMNYYPGDEYVDYIGLSSYMMHQPITDPMNQGIDRNRWSKQLDTLYSMFGHKKPIIIVEGGASYMDYDTWADITPFASYQIEDFYTYLPIKYPNVKMCFVFNSDRERQKFALSNNWSYLQGYKKGTQSPLYNSFLNNSSYTYDYYEIGNNINVKAEYTEIASYATTPLNDTCTVLYYINGEQKAVSYGIPFNANIDFTPYKGQQVTVTMIGINANSMQTINYSVRVNVI